MGERGAPERNKVNDNWVTQPRVSSPQYLLLFCYYFFILPRSQTKHTIKMDLPAKVAKNSGT